MGKLIGKVKEVREKVKEKRQHRDWKAIKRALGHTKVLKKIMIALLKPEVLTPKNFYDKLAKDIIDAKEEIIIHSPFIAAEKRDEMLLLLKRTKADVTVYTKPPEELKGWSPKAQQGSIEKMKEMGIDVHVESWMHQKAVLIDDKIAYFGSINVLSRKEIGTGDYMLRYENPLVSSLIEDYCAEVGSEEEEEEEEGSGI